MNAAAFILGVVGAVAAFVVLIKWVCSNAVVSSRLTTESSKVFGVQPKKVLRATRVCISSLLMCCGRMCCRYW